MQLKMCKTSLNTIEKIRSLKCKFLPDTAGCGRRIRRWRSAKERIASKVGRKKYITKEKSIDMNSIGLK